MLGLKTKASKEEANYRSGGKPQHRCADCVMFIKSGYCTVVAGKISPSAVCDYFRSKK